MKNYRIYILITAVFTAIYLVLAVLAIQFINDRSATLLLENEIEASKQRIKHVVALDDNASKANLERAILIESIQKSIEDGNQNNIFLSVIDWSGKIICYPDITKVGSKNTEANAMVSNVKDEVSAEELYSHIKDYNPKTSKGNYEIIHLDALPNSDLIVVTHLNLKNIMDQFNRFKTRFRFIFIILGLVVLLLLLGITRYISHAYYVELEQRSSRLEDGMMNLSKLNASLESYQKNIAIIKEEQAKAEIEALEKDEDDEDIKELPKKRLLTYIRNELMPVAIEDISHIYVENTITYIVRKDGKRYTANDSLDQIYSSLDDKLFFRANRQIIVSIYAIDKIIKFGNSSLKIETKPASEIDIVIGKNKAASFKQWLDM